MSACPSPWENLKGADISWDYRYKFRAAVTVHDLYGKTPVITEHCFLMVAKSMKSLVNWHSLEGFSRFSDFWNFCGWWWVVGGGGGKKKEEPPTSVGGKISPSKNRQHE